MPKAKKNSNKKVARKKPYKGTVIKEFSVYNKNGNKKYNIGDVYTHTNLIAFNYLINTQNIKK
jgi:hypothetical protein